MWQLLQKQIVMSPFTTTTTTTISNLLGIRQQQYISCHQYHPYSMNHHNALLLLLFKQQQVKQQSKHHHLLFTTSTTKTSNKCSFRRIPSNIQYHPLCYRQLCHKNQSLLYARYNSSSSTSSGGSNSQRATVTGATSNDGIPSSSSNNKPFVIPAHTLIFTVIFIPCAAIAMYIMNNTDDEVVQQQVRERYGTNQQVIQKNQALKEFFMNVENGVDDERLQQVLYGGRGEKKRLHAIDTELYGTEKGINIKQQTVEQIQSNTEEKKRMKKEKRRQRKLLLEQQQAEEAERNKVPSLLSKVRTAITSNIDTETVKTVATYTTIGTIAIVIGYFAGSSRK